MQLLLGAVSAEYYEAMIGRVSVEVLYSSFTEPIASGFFGYCFAGADYVYGSDGARAYSEAHGRHVPPGEDGCYITVTKTQTGAEFGTDAAGVAKLFYYNEGGIWAVGSSLAALADHLRMNGVRLTPNIPQVQAMSWGVTFTKQMSSYATIFNEVRLLPSVNRLVLSRGELRESPIRSSAPSLSYQEALRNFMRLWTSRLGTLILDERIRISIDLTGGVDSRAVFAIATTALREVGARSDRIVFKSGTGPKWKRDLKVAMQIAEKFGIPLNPAEERRRARLSGADSYHRWREVCLGVYLPIYMHDFVADPFDIHINGGGGENHRHFYPAADVSEFLNDHVKFAPYYMFAEWRHDVEDALSVLLEDTPGVDPLILHYREFRNRFHTGRPPLYRTGFAPLTTTIFHRVGNSPAVMRGGQLNFDIMASLVPELIDFPYDDPSKRPTDENRQNLTIVDLPLSGARGKTYVGSGSRRGPITPEGGRGERPMHLLAQAASKALESPSVGSLAEPALLDSAREVIDGALAAGRFEHATRAKGISYLLAADLAFGD